MNQDYKIFLHAEMDAVIRAGNRIKKAYTIRVYRYKNDGTPANACPCAVCQAMLKHTPIKNIEYTI